MKSLRLAAVGDIILSQKIARQDSDVLKYLDRADVRVGNLEMPLTVSENIADKIAPIRAHPEVAQGIQSAGFELLNFANNHTMDCGPEGLFETLQTVRDLGMTVFGAGRNLEDSLAMPVTELEGRRIAWLGVTTTLPLGSAAGKGRPGAAPIRVVTRYRVDSGVEEAPGMSPFVETSAVEGDVSLVCDRIRAAAAEADLVVVNIHWGIPPGFIAAHQEELAEYQRPLAHRLLDAGADLILGHHPHALQAVEFHANKPIFYSLGNFFVHDVLPETGMSVGAYPNYRWEALKSPWNRIGGIAMLKWSSAGDRPSASLAITKADDLGEPCWATQADADKLLERLQPLCAPLNCTATLESDDQVWSLRFEPAA